MLMNPNGEKTRYSDDELAEFKVLIENKLISQRTVRFLFDPIR